MGDEICPKTGYNPALKFQESIMTDYLNIMIDSFSLQYYIALK